jgi:hypothetical protein
MSFGYLIVTSQPCDTKITVEIGSAWHFCGMACRISINGKYHAGNRVVWFAKKAGM